MSPEFQALGIDKLSLSDRMTLVEEIWDSIVAEEVSFDIPDWHKEELKKRLQAFEADPKEGMSWEQVKRELLEDSSPLHDPL